MSQLSNKQLSYPLSGSFTGSFIGDGSGLSDVSAISQVAGNQYEIQYNTGNGVFGGVPVLIYDGTTLHATGSFTGSFNGLLTEYVATVNIGSPFPPNPFEIYDLVITQGGTYIIKDIFSVTYGTIIFPLPILHLGQRITIQNRNPSRQADIDGGLQPLDITGNRITVIEAQTTKTFIAAERSVGGSIEWLEI